MKKRLNSLGLIIGIVLIVYVIAINLISGMIIAFSPALFMLGIILVIYHFIKDKLEEYKLCRIGKKIAQVVIIIGLIGFSIIEILIIAYPKKSTDNADYILVLGAGLKNGDEVTLTLKDRLEAALQCINTYNNDGYIVVSGGQGSDEDISEAEAMKNYLVEKGISEDKVLMEDKSTNTSENFKLSKKIIEEHSKKSIKNLKVKVVTTDFHAFRSSIIADKNDYGDIEVYSSDTIGYLIPVFYTREGFAVVKTVVFD